MVDEEAVWGTGREQALGPDLPLQYGDTWPKLEFPFMKGNVSRSFINCEMNALGWCGEQYLGSIHDPLQQVFGCENPRKLSIKLCLVRSSADCIDMEEWKLS